MPQRVHTGVTSLPSRPHPEGPGPSSSALDKHSSALPFLCRNLQPPTWSLSTVFSILELKLLSHSSASRQENGGVGKRKAKDIAPTCQSRKASLGDLGPLPACTGLHPDPSMAWRTQAVRAGHWAPAPSGPEASGLVSQAARGPGAGAARDRCAPGHSLPVPWGV